MSKYTEAELKDACLDYLDYKRKESMFENLDELSFDKWWAERNKPVKKKIIDLSPLIESGIDCEFWNEDAAPFKHISKLKLIFRSPINSPDYLSSNDYPWEKCRPRMNQKMCHDGSKPIEGFVVRVYLDSVTSTVVNTSDNSKVIWSDVRAIEYLWVENGYALPVVEGSVWANT